MTRDLPAKASPNIMKDDPSKIAASLTEAQKAAFARSADEDMHPNHAGRISTYGAIDVAGELFALGLIRRLSTFSRATPLGLAVRQHLQDNQHD